MKTARMLKKIDRVLGGAEKKIEPEYVAVEFDDTRYYNIAPADKKYIKGLWTTYVFNRHEATHLAEITPSYYLAFCHTQIDFKPLAYKHDKHDEVRERLYGAYVDSQDNESTYMHCRTVDAHCQKNPRHCKVLGSFESMDDAVEECNANYPF